MMVEEIKAEPKTRRAEAVFGANGQFSPVKIVEQ
jgi:hypothetical protein